MGRFGLAVAIAFGCARSASVPVFVAASADGGAAVPSPAVDAGGPANPPSDAGSTPFAWSGRLTLAPQSASDACTQLMPADAGAPVVVSLDAGAAGACDTATSDQNGAVFVRCGARWSTFNAAGSAESQLDSYGLYWGSTDGLLGFDETSIVIPPVLQVRRLTVAGVLDGDWIGNDEHPSTINHRFRAGLVVAGLPARSPNTFAIARYGGDATLESLVNPVMPCGGEVTVAEDRSGAVAYVAGDPGAPLCLNFVDPASGAVADTLQFDAAAPTPGFSYSIPYGTWVQLFGLAGGGIAVFVNGVPTCLASPATNSIESAPGWLVSHPGESFHIIRGGDAQALVRKDADSALVTIVSADGEICGSIAISNFDFADIGFDGTLVGSSGGHEVWWPALLR